MNSNFRKKMVDKWFSYLQSQICREFEFFEKGKKKFLRRDWNKKNKDEGGGTSFLLSGGNLFDKVGVNKSTVSGKFSKNFRHKILGASKNGKYWASGISVVAHMKNPKIPAIHFNTRFIVTTKEWFGGGMDVTPSHQDQQEKKLVHDKLKEICIKNRKNYKKYKRWCDDYFYLPHREEPRGVGGVFFDYLCNEEWEKDFSFVQDIGSIFLSSYLSIIKNRFSRKFNEKDRELLLIKRGRYVEFNLLYDRGTIFGLKTGGNTEAVLMSLPPKVSWT